MLHLGSCQVTIGSSQRSLHNCTLNSARSSVAFFILLFLFVHFYILPSHNHKALWKNIVSENAHGVPEVPDISSSPHDIRWYSNSFFKRKLISVLLFVRSFYFSTVNMKRPRTTEKEMCTSLTLTTHQKSTFRTTYHKDISSTRAK